VPPDEASGNQRDEVEGTGMAFMVEEALASLAATRGSQVGLGRRLVLVAHCAEDRRLLPGITEWLRFHRAGAEALSLDTVFEPETTIQIEDLRLRLEQLPRVLLVASTATAGQAWLQGFARALHRHRELSDLAVLPVGREPAEGAWARSGELAALPAVCYRDAGGARDWYIVSPTGEFTTRLADWLDAAR
jgi:hypothetical protein